MDPLFFALFAFAGGIATALLGWAQKATPWRWRSFLTSFIRSLIAAVLLAYGANYTGGHGTLFYMFAFLSGAGVEGGANRAAGASATVITEVGK